MQLDFLDRGAAMCPEEETFRDFVFGWLLAEKENEDVMYRQASHLVTQTQTCQEYS